MSNKREDNKHSAGSWRKVDPAIWTPGPPLTGRQRVSERLIELVRFSSFWGVVLVSPVFVLLSFIVAYSVAGAALFGPVLIAFWGGLTAGFVLLMEKTGYARNFEDKTFKLSPARILTIPLAFLMILAGFYFLLFIAHKL